MPFTTNVSNGSGGVTRIWRVRAVLATILTLGATGGFFLKIIPYDAYMPLVTMALGFLFGSANNEAPKITSSIPTPSVPAPRNIDN